MKLVILIMALFITAEASSQVMVGQKAPDIALPNSKDSVISLSSFKGKVVLLDFWASWCRPCRVAMPAVVKLYNKYRAKGFEVYGVSIDDKKEAWIKAIRQDKINYTQVNDNAGWNAKAAERYGVNEIPATFLIDQEGKIAAVNLEGAELEAKIESMLK